MSTNTYVKNLNEEENLSNKLKQSNKANKTFTLNLSISSISQYSIYLVLLVFLLESSFNPVLSKRFGSAGNNIEEEELSNLIDDAKDVSFEKYLKEGKRISMENKQIKLQACSALARERATSDMEYVSLIASFVNPNSEDNESISQVMSLMIMSCFKNASVEKSKLLLQQIEAKTLNSQTKENQNLVELDKWQEVYIANNNKVVQDELTKYAEVMRDMKETQTVMMREYKKQQGKGKDSTEDNDNDDMVDDDVKRDSDNDEFYNNNNRVKEDLVLFGYELNKLNYSTKLVLGLSLLFVLVLALSIALRKALKDLPVTKQKISKKTKKEKDS